MEHKYTADILFNNQSIRTQSSDNLDQLIACVIYQIETFNPNAIAQIRESTTGRVIQTHRKISCD